MRHVAAASLLLLLALTPTDSRLPVWQAFEFRDGGVHAVELSAPPAAAPHPAAPHPAVPADWDVTDSALADVTGDGRPEWVLLVWRPWRDWPIQAWLDVASPIVGYHDAAGDSCHVIVLDPHDGREIWAGSALPSPLLALAVGDVDGDGRSELVTLEGNYARGRRGPARHIDVWRWNGFGFALDWRSPPGLFHQLRLTERDNSGILVVAVR